MAQFTFNVTGARLGDYKGKETDSARVTLQKVANFIQGLAGAAYGATSFTVSDDAASATITLSGVGGTAATGSVALSGVGGTAATGSYALSNVGGTAASGTVTLGGEAGDVTIVTDGTSVGPVAFNTSDAQTALDCITALNANGTFAAKATASSGGSGVVLITWDTKGTVGNSKTLTASRTAGTATASGATLASGAQGSVGTTINGTLVTTDTTNLSDTAAATAVAAEIELNATLGPLLVAVGSTTNVNLTWGVKGTVGNAVTLAAGTSATGTATRSAATLTGGAQGTVTVVLNGTSVGPTDVTTLTDTAAATAVAAAIEANATVGPLATVVGSTTNVSITWGTKGTVGNAITLTSTSATGTATASGATLANGAQGAVIVDVGPTPASESTDTTNLTDSAAATLLASEMNANADISALVTCSASGAVVTVTAKAAGTAGNTIALAAASDTGTATVSGTPLSGGTLFSYTL